MRRALAAISLIAAATACGTDGGSASTSASTTRETVTWQEPTSETSTTDAPTTDTPPDSPADDPTVVVPAFPESTALQFAKYSRRSSLVFVAVRVAEHEGFDRVVLEFTGTGTLGWAVNYVSHPRFEGSGDAVPINGDAVLQIFASAGDSDWTAPEYYSGSQHFQPENGGDVIDVNVGGTFEGATQVFAGIDGAPVPFRAFSLTDPPSLVVDIVDDSAD